jgi:hypothetical protein
MNSNGILLRPRRAALAVIAAVIAAASLTAFCESYRGLYLWAIHHGVPGAWAAIWPLQVDVFIAVGELTLFVALADLWPVRSRWPAWLVTVAGLAVSIAGNVGHISGNDLASRATAAVPPVAAAAALAVGLGVLKRVAARSSAAMPETGEASASREPRPPRLDPGELDPATLADASSGAARVRIAAAALGTQSPARVRAVLANAGYPMAIEAVRSGLRKRPRPERERRNVVALTRPDTEAG